MFSFVLNITARTYLALRRFMLTAIVLDAINTRRGLKWGIPAMLLAVPYALAAAFCTRQLETGGPAWLHLLALLFLVNVLKFIVNGPISLMRLLVLRWREARAALSVSGGHSHMV